MSAEGTGNLAGVFGTSRCGSTWLGSIIASHPEVAYRFEPFHRRKKEAVFLSLRKRIEAGDLDEGLTHYREYFRLLGDEQLAAALTDDGVGPRAAMVRGAEALVERSTKMFVKPNNMVHLFSWGGEIDRAVEWMQRSYEMRDHEIVYMSCMTTSKGLRTDPRCPRPWRFPGSGERWGRAFRGMWHWKPPG